MAERGEKARSLAMTRAAEAGIESVRVFCHQIGVHCEGLDQIPVATLLKSSAVRDIGRDGSAGDRMRDSWASR